MKNLKCLDDGLSLTETTQSHFTLSWSAIEHTLACSMERKSTNVATKTGLIISDTCLSGADSQNQIILMPNKN